ncbi:hypothetical protein [uncultured Sphingomonas sp.]|uniref:hypothetical protein n=1 Tax=uncultured Sphingomonas sp. TaxID=158754 RepID=UPI0025E2ADC4|nr:hypothetical protein [uncultured Sphingomonas sp.]
MAKAEALVGVSNGLSHPEMRHVRLKTFAAIAGCRLTLHNQADLIGEDDPARASLMRGLAWRWIMLDSRFRAFVGKHRIDASCKHDYAADANAMIAAIREHIAATMLVAADPGRFAIGDAMPRSAYKGGMVYGG